ncbi:DUF3667 domain-containing protein [Mucilaginibacter limnophilus]|uniref:DUF3667 domain-containing protein n=1 Tax=Mucilaginibacter limnophilus TaxID=1932778 RepID=A0A437MTH2_9SPHI|nr:DUF3667 domain-containing protein [Mucilaginibacter limnophilus]RVU00955.1 DUF3667 domain-containing protein [Mucilaginibacter limnophilus]
MKKHYRHENDCLNCGTELEGKFCHNCGQENLQLKESFGHMMTHAISDYFHFDHQFFHTLRPLFLTPGKLTNEYMAGRRAQYLHPVKMYIFVSIVYFLLLFEGSGHEEKKEVVHKKDKLTKEQAAEAKKSLEDVPFMPAAAKKRAYAEIDSNVDTASTDTSSHKKSSSVALDDEEEDTDDTGEFMSGLAEGMGASDKSYKSVEEYEAAQRKLPDGKRDGFLTRYLEQKKIAWKQSGKNGKEVIIEGIKHNAPKMMFVLLPVFALILKISFYKNRKFYVEHLIHSIHLHSFLFLFCTIIMLAQMGLPDAWHLDGWMSFLAFCTIVWYIYRSLRTVYHRSRWRTISKMVGMTFSYWFSFGVIFILMVIITALTAV